MLSASGNHSYLLSSGSWGTASNSSLDSDGAGSSYSGAVNTTSSSTGKEIKVVIIGKAGVGKSALVVRFITGRFLHSYNPTLEDTYHKTLRVDGENYLLSILDTAGQDDIHLHYYVKHADILLLAFAVNDNSSLSRARQIKMLADINHRSPHKLPVVLVGCKGDNPREVGSNADLVKLARDMDCSYVETSSAEGRNCALPFRTAIKLFNYSSCHSESRSSCDQKPGTRSSAIVRKCRNLLGMNPGGSQGVQPDPAPSRHKSHTPEPITITVSMEY